MARNFSKANSDYLQRAGAVITGFPFTFACWATTSGSTGNNLLSLGNTADDTNFLRLSSGTVGTLGLTVNNASDGYQSFNGAIPGYANGQWFHAAGVLASATDRKIYANGAQIASGTTNAGWPSGLNVTTLGCLQRTSRIEFLDGLMAHAAIWSAALDANEIASLVSGASPTSIRPGSLVEYWPLEGFNRREEPGSVSGRALNVSGTRWAPGPLSDPPRAPGLHLAAQGASPARWQEAPASLAAIAARPPAPGRLKKWYPGLGRDRGRRRP